MVGGIVMKQKSIDIKKIDATTEDDCITIHKKDLSDRELTILANSIADFLAKQIQEQN